MNIELVRDALGGVAGMVVAVAVLAVAITAIIRTLVRLLRWLRGALTSLEVMGELIQRELATNGGDSMRDQLAWLCAWAREHEARHDSENADLWAVLASHGIERRQR